MEYTFFRMWMKPCERVKIAAGKNKDFVPRRSLSLSKCFMSSAACTSQRKQLKCTRRKSGNRDLWEKTTHNQYGCGSWSVMVMMPCRYSSSDATCCFRCVSFLVTLFWVWFFLLYTSIYNFILCIRCTLNLHFQQTVACILLAPNLMHHKLSWIYCSNGSIFPSPSDTARLQWQKPAIAAIRTLQ